MQWCVLFGYTLKLWRYFFNPNVCLFRTSKFITDWNFQPISASSINMLGSHFNLDAKAQKQQKLMKEFIEVFWNMTHNSFILEYANGILIESQHQLVCDFEKKISIILVPFFVFNNLISVTNFQMSNVYISVLSLYKRIKLVSICFNKNKGNVFIDIFK